MKKKNDYVFLLIMTFIRYLGDCFFYTFLAVFLMSRGLAEDKIGLISCLFPLLALISNPIWNRATKNVNQSRKIMMVITVIEGILIMIYSHIAVYEWFIISALMLGIIDAPFYSLHDGFAETYALVNNKKYANIRVFGTIGYLAGTLLAALLLYLFNNNYMILFYLSGICLSITAFVFMLVKPIDLKLISKEEVKPEYKKILKNKKFIVFLIVDFLIIGVSKGADNYVSTFFTSFHNLSPSNWSLLFTLMLVTETITLILFGKIKKINANVAFIIAHLFYFLRFFVLGLDLPLGFHIAFSLLRGLAFGIHLAFLVKAIEEILGLKNLTAGIFVIGTVEALIRTIAIFTFGNVIVHIGYLKFFLIVAAIILLGMIINIIFNIKIKFKYQDVSSNIQ